ncbi:RecBCD enzyme subunit RecB [Dyadobacter sp. CECT 9275]|uniref:DNA 3'-5' helicase n=1 Tax=Dyadobacter helix TaxID=2822344 RepID=A0A916NBU9_9BACT|nr:UvrD-helicase domain-containing protein [Dyadobacter sp. CECT 9275]CAG4997966.1 RecBCD enzyme subunit RecB [Dyadobacter sp. CECT 9275]
MFKVYSSSAGSGKTYTLTKEYLKLALHSASETYFRNILAVTFTNAAANEMKERILLMLRIFSQPQSVTGEIPPMLRDIITELYPATQEDQQLFEEVRWVIAARAKLVFTQILHRYSDFSVMTIDKFTQRLVSSFTDELGLPFVFETQLEADLLGDAVDRLLARIGQEGEEVLTEIVENYYREKAEEGSSWGSLPVRIRETSEMLLNEEAYLKMKRVADFSMEDWNTIRKQIRRYIRKKDDEIADLGKDAMGTIAATFLADKDFYQGARGIFGYFRSRKEGQKLWEEPNAYVRKTIGEDMWYGGKTPTLIKDKIDEIKPVLTETFEKIETIRSEDAPKMSLYKLLDRHLYSLSLLGEIRKEFDILLRLNGQVHISDFNRRILEIVSSEPIPFIFERLGEKYNHILLDEFQDTSKLQFANLLPLIENALGEGYFNLVVGDAKQSIYRFRGGDMDLILHLSKDQIMSLTDKLGDNHFVSERLMALSSNLAVDHLKTNRRSYYEITAFNNQFFSFVADNLGEQYPLVQDVFDENFQQEIPAGVKHGGHVQVEFLKNEPIEAEFGENGDEPDAILLRTTELIAQLREEGFNWRDIAILCRKKKDAAALANELRQHGYPLISDDALTLAYSRSVHFVVSFMKVLHSADHKLARYEAAYLFHHEILKENPSASEYEAIRSLAASLGLDAFLAYFSRWGIELTAFRMRQISVFELSEMLIQRFGLFENGSDNEYLFRFLDVVLDYGNRKSNHLGDFLTFWDTARYKTSITIPADTDALRITTIHKSKGLEYPVVIIPYADWKVTPGPLDRLWADLDDAQYEELRLFSDTGIEKRLLSSMVSVGKGLENSVLAGQYTEHQTRTLVENLNLLYVAFTRSVQQLYILAKKEKSWTSGQRVSHWLHDFLSRPDAHPAWSDEETTFVLSQGFGNCFHTHSKSEAKPFIVHEILSNDRSQSLRLRRMADRIFDINTFEPKHDKLQKTAYLLTTLRMVSELPKTVQRIISEGIVTKQEAELLLASVQVLLAEPSLRELYDDRNLVSINKEMLIPGGGMLHVDRAVQMTDGSLVLMRIVAGKGNEEPRRHIRKLVCTFNGIGRASRGVIITLENNEIEWIR